MGIAKGDRVAFMTHNCLDYIYCRLGLSKIGAAPVPLNFMLKGEEIVYIIQDSEPKAFFVEDSLVESVVPSDPSSPVCSTSGGSILVQANRFPLISSI